MVSVYENKVEKNEAVSEKTIERNASEIFSPQVSFKGNEEEVEDFIESENNVKGHNPKCNNVDGGGLEELKCNPLGNAITSKWASGPTWVYGTTDPKRNVSSSGSGLLLANKGHIAIASPEVIQNYLYPISELLEHKILNYRNKLSRLLRFELTPDSIASFDNPLLVVTGPSFISTSNQIRACCQWVGSLLGKQFKNAPHELLPPEVTSIFDNNFQPKHLMLAIRANLTGANNFYGFETHNSSAMTYEIAQGMPFCRALLDEISEICPIVGETSDTITPQYLSDLFCLGLVSSTLVESQLHRELSSGVSYPVGFNTIDSHLPFNKSMYTYKIQAALDAMFASKQQHQFLSVNKLGTVTVVGTAGNDETFIILQVNLQFSFEELKTHVKTVYSSAYMKLGPVCPKIMLDVGKVDNKNYEEKLTLLKLFLTEEDQFVKYKIIGVIIDSGDNYVPQGQKVDLTQTADQSLLRSMNGERMNAHSVSSSNSYHQNFEDMNRYFERNRISSHEDPINETCQPSTSEYYECFINANKLIAELDKLSKNRRYK